MEVGKRDFELTCCYCGKKFLFTSGEQLFYYERGLSLPKRCAACRELAKKEKELRYLSNLMQNNGNTKNNAKGSHIIVNSGGNLEPVAIEYADREYADNYDLTPEQVKIGLRYYGSPNGWIDYESKDDQ